MAESALVDLIIRDAAEADAQAIAAIYSHHVLNSVATYELVPPSVDETLTKMRRLELERWPFLVAVSDGEVVGYAYVTQFRDRAAYRFAAEDSIYIDARRTGTGIGKVLLKALLERSSTRGFHTIVGVIGGAEPASIALHARLGFVEVGRLKNIGFKFDRWLDSVYMQRHLT